LSGVIQRKEEQCKTKGNQILQTGG